MRGGARPGAGRKPGSPNKRTREVAIKALKKGIAPLDYMLSIVRNRKAPREQRMAMAAAAAPYCHPRLSAILAPTPAPETPGAAFQAAVKAKLSGLFGLDEAEDDSVPKSPAQDPA